MLAMHGALSYLIDFRQNPITLSKALQDAAMSCQDLSFSLMKINFALQGY